MHQAETTVPPQPYTTGSVTSADGTAISYRQVGAGPGLILLHGGMMTAQNFLKLAVALADTLPCMCPTAAGASEADPR